MNIFNKYFKPSTSSKDVSELKVKKGVFRTLYKGVKIPWLSLILGSIFAVFNSLIILTQYDNYMAIFTGNMKDLTPLWIYLGASLLQYIVIFAGVLADLGFVTINTNVRKKMWKKILHLPLKDLDVESPNGMLSRITSDSEYASKPFYAIIATLQIVTYILSISKVAPKNLPQALIILAITLLLALITVVFSVRLASKAVTLVQNSISLLTNHYTEELSNILFIKAVNGEEKAISKSDELIDNRYKASLYNAFAVALQTLANNFSDIIIYSCAFLGGIIAINANTITSMDPVNEIYVFGMALQLTLAGIMTMPSYFASTFGGSKKLVSVFRLDEENIINGKDLPNEIDDIKLDHVSFAYDNKMVVNDVNCVIPKGKTTAIIGQNGSGKSTLIKLVDRLYESNKGDIYYGTNKAKDVSLKSWRNEFAIVSQDAHLFSGSIKANITYGLNHDASDKEINDAITKANLTDVIASHEEGLNYNIGIKGSHLSGGEQQRIAIARAIIKNPNYLILDEASANLDKKTEKEVIDSLKELMKNRTTIVIAHDYSAIENADNIIVLDHGAIKYSGTKDEILAKSNILQEMFNN